MKIMPKTKYRGLNTKRGKCAIKKDQSISANSKCNLNFVNVKIHLSRSWPYPHIYDKSCYTTIVSVYKISQFIITYLESKLASYPRIHDKSCKSYTTKVSVYKISQFIGTYLELYFVF